MSSQWEPWTEERTAKLRVLWGGGLSGSEIAARLGGISRNAVIGKVHRLGLSGRRSNAGGVPKGTPRSRKRPAPAAPSVSRDMVECISPPHAAPVPLLDLEPGMCRWPIGDPGDENFGFCSCKKTHGAYCSEHGRIAYLPVVRRHAPKLEMEAA